MLGKRRIACILTTAIVLGLSGGVIVDATELKSEKNITNEELWSSKGYNSQEDLEEESFKKSDDKEISNKEISGIRADYNYFDSLEEDTPKIYEASEKEVIDVNIISTTPITVEEAKRWARSKGATEEFVGLADLFWKYAPSNGGVNPALAYVQSAKETGYGKFGGVIDASYHNTCGLKTTEGGGNYDPEAHQRFDDWDQGVQAHLDHLALYAGASGYPRANTYDPRHFPSIGGTAKTVYALGGKWAPSSSYGTAIAGLYRDMMKSAGHIDQSDDTTSSDDIGWKLIDGRWYYYDANNSLEYGWIKDQGKWYYMSKTSGALLTGWINDGYDDYYMSKDDGSMQFGWQHDGYDWYYLNPANGVMQTGWINDGTGDYYLNPANGVMQTGWIHDGYDDYYMSTANGSMQKGWQHDGYDWYYLNPANGVMQTGWINDGTGDYFLNKSNGVMQTGWAHDGYDWYYLSLDDGSMQTGLISANGYQYLLKYNGVMQTGWQYVNGNWHYFDQGGRMVKNATVDGYYINHDGIYRTKKLIAIDAGHSKVGDKGSNTVYNGRKYHEGELNLAVALKLEDELINRGYDVLMIRDENVNTEVSLSQRAEIANNAKADLFISIHHDSGPSSAKGVTSFYSTYKPNIDTEGIIEKNGWGGTIKADETPSEQAKLGKELSDNLVNKLATGNSFSNRSSHDRNLYVTRETIMPSILVECGFITNSSEMKRLLDPSVQNNTAKLIADSVDKLYQ